MIVTKQRKSLQPSSPYTRNQKYRYTNQDHDGLFRDYRLESQSVPINYANRQRHNLSTVSPISKTSQHCYNSYSKKTDKKYDYSVNLDHSIEIDHHMNRTHDNINEKYRYELEPKRQSFKGDFIPQNYEKRRVSSVNQTSSKYPFTETKPRNHPKPYEIEPSKNQNIDHKIDLKTYLKNYEPQYASVSKEHNRNKNVFTSTKEQQSLAKRVPLSQNFMQDNFGATDKFKEFKYQNRSKEYEETKVKSKYESKYAGMRNNKRYEITKEEPQKEMVSTVKPKDEDKENTYSAVEKPLDVQKLLKQSSTQNSNIVQKINRIQKLNQEINKRLEGMLNRKKVS